MQTFTKLLLAGLLFAASGAFAQDQISVQSSCAATESADKNQPPAGMIKTGEMTVTNAETGETTTADSYSPPPKSIADLYMEGGYIWMSMITICLIAMLFAAWKAPPLGKGSRFGCTDAGLDLFHDRIIRHFGDYRQRSTRRHIIRKQVGDTFQRSEGNRNRTDIRHDRLLHLASPAHCRETENLNLNRLLSGNQEPFRL